jgi:hypothetical protein
MIIHQQALIELPWPARLQPEPQVIRGRAFAGENRVAAVEYRIDEDRWKEAVVAPPEMPSAWVRWQFDWHPAPGDHVIRVRATDDRGRTQPDTVPLNELGYCYNAVLPHPVRVQSAP